jgi:hypothetical protein
VSNTQPAVLLEQTLLARKQEFFLNFSCTWKMMIMMVVMMMIMIIIIVVFFVVLLQRLGPITLYTVNVVKRALGGRGVGA